MSERAKVYDSFLDVGSEDPRIAFMEELITIAEKDDRVVALDADVSRRTLSRRFRDRFPDRFWDFGVAEQNVMGVTAGLAASGRIPFAFAFAVFVSMRAVEPIRTSICYPRLNAKIIGGYAGLSDGKDGATHQAIEDISIMRSFPNLVVMSPSDKVIARKIARAAYEHEGPVYVRIEYEATPVVHRPEEPFRIGRGYVVREGRDVTIATYGIALARAVEAARVLSGEGIDVEVLDMPTLKPLDTDLLVASVRKTGALVTLEDHSVIGGLASAACQTLMEAQVMPRFRALGLQDVFTESGKNNELRVKFGVDAGTAIRTAREIVSEARR